MKKRTFYGVILALAALCFAGASFAQGLEHLSLPAASVTDKPLPPARDSGGIYLPHPSGQTQTGKAGAAKKAKTEKTAKKKTGAKTASKAKKKSGKASQKTDKKADKKTKTKTAKTSKADKAGKTKKGR